MPAVQITSLDTETAGGQSKDLFNPFTDSLKLVISLSPDLVQADGIVLGETFRLIELRTNQVVVDRYVQASYDGRALGPNVLWWLGSPSPHDWGLVWVAGDIFGFRAAVEVSQRQGESGLVALDAFAVFETRWFRWIDSFQF